jgi:hypothetical protein
LISGWKSPWPLHSAHLPLPITSCCQLEQ